ncbi:helix-turn-helix transcriptional regulator [Anaerobacillus isosaccharinicus]|uniref:Helix-turn-helix transcriptional regulator n=1 Tax=Anaerobacillus isosaccharinicus TaxID=1532552 RepID=A0A7S7R9Q1_9BACI|nr:AraC family transcriptional regulator [Anaerobacillus isosaccharinicus]MBA5587736.1 helix-turn-helix transcriptional regulator [Anaerobacillus isosaccharinicus]QOY34101.1 helix-turn-helix transcriptional regulator [Anaerobacillus isosaccharinicus]
MDIISFEVPPFPTYINGGEDCFRKGKKHMKRNFSVFDILLVKKGVIYMCENDVKYDVVEGNYLILTPGLEHFSYKPCSVDTYYYWLHFNIEGTYQLKKMSEINWGMIVKQERTYTEPARHTLHLPRFGQIVNKEFIYQELDKLLIINETNRPEKRLMEQIIFQQLILQLQSDSIRIPTSAELVTKQTINYIQQHYKQETLKMTDISKELLFHADYITRCMQKTVGVTPIQYLTSYRLQVAKQFLSTTNEKLESISKQVGIHDSTYFSRVFKKVEGISPIEYRRLANREGK